MYYSLSSLLSSSSCAEGKQKSIGEFICWSETHVGVDRFWLMFNMGGSGC